MDREILFRGMSDTAADLMIANAQIDELKNQLAESQRRERAAVEDIVTMAECKLLGTCTFCAHRNTPDARYAPCKGCIQLNRSCLHFEWRGPQKAGKGNSNG